jgi:hypothetical protein
MDYNLHSFVRLNVIIGLSSWGWRDICEEIAASQVTGWCIQEIHQERLGRIHHKLAQTLQRCVPNLMITLSNIWKADIVFFYVCLQVTVPELQD